MKFTTALVTLAAGASAMPWASHFGTGKHHRNTKDDVTVHIKVDQSPVRSSKLHASNFEICWLVCLSEAPTCPDGWYSNNMGSGDSPCWTCCKAPEDEGL